MKIGARNILKGGAKRVKPGVVNDEVIISLEGGAEIVAVITRESAEKMGLSDGKEVYAIIKASSVMIGID